MSSPALPHLSLPIADYAKHGGIPIPIWIAYAALVLIAVTSFYQYRKHQDGGAGLFGLVAVGAMGWLYFKGFTYFDPKDPVTIKPFGILVALGVYIGSIVARRHGKERGLDLMKMDTFIIYVVGLGFVGGHVLDAIFYTPEKIAADPLYIVKLWAGLSSFGGFIGAIFGALLYRSLKREKILPYVDTVCSAFPLAWVFGRAGCSFAHDHPGLVSSAWYAVKCTEAAPAYQGTAFLCSHLPPGSGRLDLGLIEFALTIPLATAFYFAWRAKPRPFGFFSGWMSIAYAPIRFGLDFLRIDSGGGHEGDPRHFGLTPAQWACFGLLALGIYLVRTSQKQPTPATYEEAQREAAEAEEARLAAELDDEDDDDLDEDEDDDDEVIEKKPAAKPGSAKTEGKASASKAAAAKPAVTKTASAKVSTGAKPAKSAAKPSGEATKPREGASKTPRTDAEPLKKTKDDASSSALAAKAADAEAKRPDDGEDEPAASEAKKDGD